MTVSHVSDVTLLRRRYQLLPEGILPRVEEHLAECESCRARSEELGQAWRLFDSWSLPAVSDESLVKSLEEALRAPMRRPMAPPPRPRGEEVRTERPRTTEPRAPTPR